MAEISKTVRVLSLDGGGMRGIIQATFLEQFKERLGLPENGALSDCFDIIVGTSTGGMQAICYAAGKSPKEFKELLEKFGQFIFTTDFTFHAEGETPDQDIVPDMINPRKGIRATDKHCLQRLYYKDNLPAEAKNYVRPYLYSNKNLKIKLKELLGTEAKTKDLLTTLVLPVWNETLQKPEHISSSLVLDPERMHQETLLWNLALACGGSPLYFPSHKIHKNTYSDFSTFSHNPALTAYILAKTLYPYSEKFCLLSLGTGQKFQYFRNPSAIFPGPLPVHEHILKTFFTEKWLLNIPLRDVSVLSLPIESNIESQQILAHQLLELESLNSNTNLYYYRGNPELGSLSYMDGTSPADIALYADKAHELFSKDEQKIIAFMEHMKA